MRQQNAMYPLHALAVLIVRVWALTTVIEAIGSIPFYWVSLASNNDGASSWAITSLIASFVWIVVGILAWFIAPRLASRILPNQSADPLKLSITADELVMLGSFLIGGFYLAQYVPTLIISIGSFIIEAGRQDPALPYWAGQLWSHRIDSQSLASNFLIVLVALWMAFRPSHVAHFFAQLRYAGVDKNDTDKTEIKQ